MKRLEWAELFGLTLDLDCILGWLQSIKGHLKVAMDLFFYRRIGAHLNGIKNQGGGVLLVQ